MTTQTSTTNYLRILIPFFLFCSLQFVRAQNKESTAKTDSENILTNMLSIIKTEVDTSFVYNYKNAKFVPPNGQTLLIMGQTVERINEYLSHFPNKQIPGGWSAYWGVPEFKGIKDYYKTESGDTQNHQMLVDKFSNTVINSGMWMVGKWNVAKFTSDGNYDKVIRKYAKWAKKINRPIYLRIGYEFDGPHNELEPREYVKAYKHIVDIMRNEGVSNVAYVWHSCASKPYKDYKLSEWYPGDDYIDWVAISVFMQPYDDIFNHKETNDVLNFAKDHKKPVMIAEANPVLGISKTNTKVWDDWFVDFFSFCYQKNIKAIAFINEDWQRLNINGIEGWKDARLYNNDVIAKAWFMEVTKERYLKQSPDLFKTLNYPSKTD